MLLLSSSLSKLLYFSSFFWVCWGGRFYGDELLPRIMTSNISLFDLIILDWLFFHSFPVQFLSFFLCALIPYPLFIYLFSSCMCGCGCVCVCVHFYILCLHSCFDSTISIIALFCINNLMRNNACIHSNHNEIYDVIFTYNFDWSTVQQQQQQWQQFNRVRCIAFAKVYILASIESVICAPASLCKNNHIIKSMQMTFVSSYSFDLEARARQKSWKLM